jgi:hypothetical protein
VALSTVAGLLIGIVVADFLGGSYLLGAVLGSALVFFVALHILYVPATEFIERRAARYGKELVQLQKAVSDGEMRLTQSRHELSEARENYEKWLAAQPKQQEPTPGRVPTYANTAGAPAPVSGGVPVYIDRTTNRLLKFVLFVACLVIIWFVVVALYQTASEPGRKALEESLERTRELNQEEIEFRERQNKRAIGD